MQFTGTNLHLYLLMAYAVSAVIVAMTVVFTIDEGRSIYDRVKNDTHDFDWQMMPESQKQLGMALTGIFFVMMPIVNTFFALSIIKDLIEVIYVNLHDAIFGVTPEQEARRQAEIQKRIDKYTKHK
jgi:hypothetical protein